MSRLLAAACFTGVAAMPVVAQAAEGEAVSPADSAEDIIVTAQRRDQAITDTSVSVAVFNEERLESINAQDVRDLALFAPSLTYVKSAQINQIAIRGLGSPGLDDFESAVGFYTDGIYSSKSRNALTPFFDLAGVEVLRGPQGVLFGKNALSGVVSIRTAEPEEELGGYVTAQAGSFNLFEATGAVTGSVSDAIGLRLAGIYRRRGGYLDDLGPGRGDGGRQRTYGVRARANVALGEATNLSLKYEWFKDYSHGYERQLTSVGPADAVNPAFDGIETELDRRLYSSQTGIYDVEALVGTKAHIAMAELDHEFGNGSHLTLTGGYTNFNHALRRVDALPIDTLLQANPTRNQAATIELRLTSADDGPFRYILGAYGDRTWTDRGGFSALNFTAVGAGVRQALIANGIPAALLPSQAGFDAANTLILSSPFSQRGKSWALFGELSHEIGSTVTVTGGLRYSHDTVSIRRGFGGSLDANGNMFASVASYAAIVPIPGLQIQPGVTLEQLLSGTFRSVYSSFIALPPRDDDVGSLSDGNFQPALRIEYRPTGSLLLYATGQTGTKQGGFNSSTLLAATSFRKESAMAFEIGAKYSFDIGYLTFAAFRTDFDDLQVSAVNTAGAVDTTNAAKALSQGFEAELAIQPVRGIRVGVSYSYVDAHYRRFLAAPCSIDQIYATPSGENCSQDLSGAPLPNAPRHSASAYFDLNRPIGNGVNLVASASIGWKADYYTEISDSRQQKADSLAIVSGRIGVDLPDTGISLFLVAKNLFDERGAIMRQRASNARDPGTILSVINEPRSLAVEARMSF